METTYTITITQREHSAILAALRNWQADSTNEDMAEEFEDFFIGACGPCLGDDEIDALCDRLNFTPEDLKPAPPSYRDLI